MAAIPRIQAYVGETIPIRYSFLSRLLDFKTTSQALQAASVTWTSNTPSLATFSAGSEGLVTSDQGAANGISNDAVIGSFVMVAAGICTVKVSVTAINPSAVYVGVLQYDISAVPSP